MRGQRNFQAAIPLMGFLDESFWVRMPWGKGRHRPSKSRQFHACFSTVSSEPSRTYICRPYELKRVFFAGWTA